MSNTIAGGYYGINDQQGNTKYYDAWGRELEEKSGKVLEKEIKDEADLGPAEIEAQTRQRQAQIAAEEAERTAEKTKAAAKEADRAAQQTQQAAAKSRAGRGK